MSAVLPTYSMGVVMARTKRQYLMNSARSLKRPSRFTIKKRRQTPSALDIRSGFCQQSIGYRIATQQTELFSAKALVSS